MSASVPTNFEFEPIQPKVSRQKKYTAKMIAGLNAALDAFKTSVLNDSVDDFARAFNLLSASKEDVFSVEARYPIGNDKFIRMSLLECAMTMGASKVAGQIIALGLRANDRESARELRHISNCIGKQTGTPEILASYESVLVEVLRPHSEDHATHMLKEANTAEFLEEMGEQLQAIYIKAATSYLYGSGGVTMPPTADSSTLH